MAEASDLALYLFDGCPYCERVRGALEELDVQLEERNIHRDLRFRDELMAERGQATVPVLRIQTDAEDTWMPESSDIVAYLFERFGDGRRPPLSVAPYFKLVLWGLLLAGGWMGDPMRSGLWTAACLLAAGRAGWLAYRTGVWIHTMIAMAFLVGAISIPLASAGLADLPWWWAAVAVLVAAMFPAMRRRR